MNKGTQLRLRFNKETCLSTTDSSSQNSYTLLMTHFETVDICIFNYNCI